MSREAPQGAIAVPWHCPRRTNVDDLGAACPVSPFHRKAKGQGCGRRAPNTASSSLRGDEHADPRPCCTTCTHGPSGQSRSTGPTMNSVARYAAARPFTEPEIESLRCPGFTPLLLLESLARKLERSAVLRDRAYHVLRRSGWNLGLHLQRHFHLCPDQAREMCDHLVGDPAGVTSHTGRIEGDRAVEPLRHRRC